MPIPATVQGPVLMILAVSGLALMNTIVRIAAEDIHVFQVVFFRNIFALIFMMPWLFASGFGGLKTTRLRLHLVRSLTGFTAMVLWFLSLSLLPLVDATALNFTIPLFITLGAAVFLGESVRLRRSLATLIGFVGVLIIIRPGFEEVSIITGAPVLAAAFMAAAMLMVKSLSGTERPQTMVLYMNFFMTLLAIPLALFVWQWPSAEVWAMCLLIGLLGALCHIGIAKAMTLAEAASLAPLDYARMPVTAVLAFALFGEIPDLWTWVGAGIIIGSSFYITRREAQIAREGRRNLDLRVRHDVTCSDESHLNHKSIR